MKESGHTGKEKLGAKIISKIETIKSVIQELKLTSTDKNKYYSKSFELDIPQTELDKLKN